METQVCVTLTALNGDIYPAERVLNLAPDCEVISIGRASKSINKGIVGAIDNAWFDSPVMSRDHAELSLNLEDNTVEIIDIGSMHGTFLNNAGLTQHQPSVVNDNDIVVFGTRVTRGAESIPACAFRIALKYSPYKNKSETLTFACPDSSDIDEGFDVSDDEAAERPSSDDGVSIGSPQSKAPQAISTIDLTGDEEPIVLRVNKDITTSKLSDVEDNKDISLDHNAPLVDDVSAEPMAIVLDSDDEDNIVPPTFEYHSDETNSDDQISFYEYPLDGPSTKVQGVEASDRLSTREPEPAYHGSAEPLVPDNLIFNMDETHVRNTESNMTDCGSDSDLDLSDARIEGIRAYYGLSEAPGDDLYDEATSEGRETSHSFMVKKDHTKTCDLNDEFLESTKCTCEAIEEARDITLSVKYATMSPVDKLPLSARQSSPSDAAMVKGTVSQTSKPVPVHHLPSDDWKQLTTKSLLEKISKRATIETRDSNDTLLPGHRYFIARPPPATNSANLDVTNSQKLEANTSRSISPPVHSSQNHGQDLIMDRPPSPFLNMTSAVKYNESNALMTGAIIDATCQPGRSNLRIDDIIDNSTTPEPENRKRKADEISNVIEGEFEAWQPSPPLDQTEDILDITASGPVVSIQSTLASTKQEMESGTPGQRSKRLKKVMEGAAYIALGGVGLFSILVATAPDYL